MAKTKIGDSSSGPDILKKLSSPMLKSDDWLRVPKAVELAEDVDVQHPLEEIERELVKVKRDLSQTKMERDILKKAVAYFTRELRNNKW